MLRNWFLYHLNSARVSRWTEDGAEWRRDNDLDFPSSKSVTRLAVIHRYHSAVREVQPWVWCVVSHSCSSQAGKTTNFFITLSLVLTFLLDAAHLQKVVKLTPHFPRRHPERKQRYITWTSAFGKFAFSNELRVEKLLFLICQSGVHITGSDNFRSCAFVSMVTRREGEGFLGVSVCVCVGTVGRRWAQTDTCTDSQKINNHSLLLLLSAAVITSVAPVFSYQSESAERTCTEVQNNTETHPRPAPALLWLTVSQPRSCASHSCPLLCFVDAISLFSEARCWRQIGSFVSRRLSCIVLRVWILQPAPVAGSNNEINDKIFFFPISTILFGRANKKIKELETNRK